jgi:hypothetical protein
VKIIVKQMIGDYFGGNREAAAEVISDLAEIKAVLVGSEES